MPLGLLAPSCHMVPGVYKLPHARSGATPGAALRRSLNALPGLGAEVAAGCISSAIMTTMLGIWNVLPSACLLAVL